MLGKLRNFAEKAISNPSAVGESMGFSKFGPGGGRIDPPADPNGYNRQTMADYSEDRQADYGSSGLIDEWDGGGGYDGAGAGGGYGGYQQGYDSEGPMSFENQNFGGPPAQKIIQQDSVEDFEEMREGDAIGPWQAGWNVTNAIQGMFIVSLPFAVLHGGWWGVVAMAGVAWICYYTGLILVECLYDEQGQRVRNSYVQVAEVCWGKLIGGRLVHIAQLIELLMTCILYVVLCGDLLEGSFPQATMDKTSWMMMSSIMMLACALLTDLRTVSVLSFWNTISHIAINAIILFHCLTMIGHWYWSRVRFTVDIQTFPTVLGIIVFSYSPVLIFASLQYTSHIFLPTLEGNMIDRRQFRPMLKWSHIAAAVFKSSFALIGFLSYGQYTQEEVTNNLPTQQFKTVINIILVAKALLSYPLPYYAAVKLLETAFFKGKPRTIFPSCFGPDSALREWGIALRICLVLFILFMAISIPHFAYLMGLIGSFTGCMLSFIWPCVFHLKLKGPQLDQRTKIKDYTIIGLGLSFGIVGIIYSSAALARAMNALDEYD